MRLALAIVAALSATAAADPAETLFGDGRALLAKGQAAAACSKFEAALALDPIAPGVLLNLGLCNEQQKKLASALRWFAKAQTLAAEHGMTEVEDAARAKVRALAAHVPSLRIDVPAGVTVTIDGAAVEATSLAHLEIDEGHHVVELHGGGAYGEPQPIDVPADARDQHIALRVEKAPPPPAPSHRRRNAWILAGIGGALFVADGVIGLVGKHEFDSSHDVATREHWKNVVHYGSTATFVAGAIAIGGASYLYFTASPEQAGVTVAGRF